MLENYLHTQGREWERYAWVKAREIERPAGAGARRDRHAVRLSPPPRLQRHRQSLRELHAQIRAEVGAARPARQHQAGAGRHPRDRVRRAGVSDRARRPGRRPAAAAHAGRPSRAWRSGGCCRPRPSSELRLAYVFLRNLEHRLQYLEDQQTQRLPANPEDLAAVAHAMGCADDAALRTVLEGAPRVRHPAVRSRVREHRRGQRRASAGGGMDRRCEQRRSAGVPARARLPGRPADLRAPASSCVRAAAYRRMSASTQARVDQLVPRLLELAAQFEHPDATLERLARVIESIGRRESYLALAARVSRGALGRLAALAAASPWAADYLAQHPVLLDELISQQAFEPPDWASLRDAARCRSSTRSRGNTERQMDMLAPLQAGADHAPAGAGSGRHAAAGNAVAITSATSPA